MNMLTTKTPRPQGNRTYFRVNPGKKLKLRKGLSWRLGALAVQFPKVFLVCLLVFSTALTPGLIRSALAQDAGAPASPTPAAAPKAPADQVAAVKQLAQKGYWGGPKDSVSKKSEGWTPDDITDALLQVNEGLSAVKAGDLEPGDKTYHLEDLQMLLKLVKAKSGDIRARKASAWKLQNKIQKMITALTPEAAESTPEAPEAAAQAAPTATPVPGPSREEFSGMKDDLKDLSKKVGDLQGVFDKKMAAVQKAADDNQASNAEVKASAADNLEQLTLVKRLLDRVQDDLKKTDDHLEEVAKKASEKSISDVELEQELNIMHKDLRDNTQDVSILKQQVAKLDKSGEQAGESPLDSVLSSKWLGGGALVVGITALVISLTRK